MKYLAAILFMATLTAAGQQHVPDSNAEVLLASTSVALRICAHYPTTTIWVESAGTWGKLPCSELKKISSKLQLTDYFDHRAAQEAQISKQIDKIQAQAKAALEASRGGK